MDVEILKKSRKRAGLSQWVVARAVGRTQTWLCNIELGYVRPSEEEFVRIAVAIERLREEKSAA
jgi:predicted transcriptional regulator